jgi:CBS domain containing-hemolysin-like protein
MDRISDDEYIFSARVDLDDINDIMSVELPTAESDTLGGLVYTMLGRVPTIGDSVDVTDVRLTVLAVEGRRIGTVKIQRLKQDEDEDNQKEKEATTLPNQSSSLMSNPHNVVSSSR